MKESQVKEPLIHLTKRTDCTKKQAWGIRGIAFLASLLCCGLVSFFLVDKIKADPSRIVEFYQCFINGSFKTDMKFMEFLKCTAILLCISLAITPAFRMRFWNIGAEGQTLMGVWGAIAISFYFGGKIPEALLIVLMFLSAIVCGTVWAVIPALFKAKWNTNETLFTLMMNYIATFIVAYFLIAWVPSGSSSLAMLPYGRFPRLPFDKSGYLLIIIIVVALAFALYAYLTYSKHGYEISVVGESENTAKYIGINVKKVIVRTMILSGALCGLAGFLIGSGLDMTVTENSVGGQGFTAILVSWLGQFNPIFMLVTSAIIIFLQQGASEISMVFDVRGALPNIFIGIVLFFIIGCEFFINYRVHFRKRQPKEEDAK